MKVPNYEETYSGMLDDQLLILAQQMDTLTLRARGALAAELARRNLGPQDVAEREEYYRRLQSEAEQKKPIASWVNGVGTAVYGRRDFKPDGSFLTTKWVVLFWIPLIPLKSLRVQPVSRAFFEWPRRYYVQTQYPPHIRQTLSVILYVLSFPMGWWALDSFHAGPRSAYVAFVLWVCLPWYLRRRARADRSLGRD